MKTVIALRSSPDYKSLNKELFAKQLNNRFGPHSEIKTVIQHDLLNIWNKCFAMPYLDYRYKIAKIAQSNLQNTGCDIVNQQSFKDIFLSNEEIIITPIDDDDWFSPDII